MFSEEDGEPWWPSRFEWAWQEFRKSSRLAPRFHDLRHTALSLMLRQGNSPKVVQEIAGHHSSAYTMDTYCWSDRRTQRAAADSIGDLFSGALGAVEKQSGNKSGNNSEAVPPLTCDNVVHLSAADADKWLPLLHQVTEAKTGAERPIGPSISDGYEAVSRLTQSQTRLTEDAVAEMVAGYRAGSTILELASRHACDRKTVIRYLKLHCVEIRYRALSPIQIDEAVRLYESGLSLIKIGRVVGADPKTVKARLVERGIQLR